MYKKEIKNAYLVSWEALNSAMQWADEALCKSLLREEMKGRARPSFMSRIHSRLNKVRADRERAELKVKTK